MQRLFLFLYKYRSFIFFLFLEGLCAFLIVRYNTYQQSVYLNSSNAVAASLLDIKANTTSYLTLSQENRQLMEENKRLREALIRLGSFETVDDSIISVQTDSTKQYFLHKAEVVNNTTNLMTNYLTLRGGRNQGLKKGDALINDDGIVGTVTHVSENYATAISLLHINNHVSAEIKRTKTICSAKWKGTDPRKSKLLYVPRHIEVLRGDTIVTSGYNSIFPAGIDIGVVEEVTLSPDATFYEIDLNLTVDFTNLSYVYSVHNVLKPEQDSLEYITEETIQR